MKTTGMNGDGRRVDENVKYGAKNEVLSALGEFREKTARHRDVYSRMVEAADSEDAVLSAPLRTC